MKMKKRRFMVCFVHEYEFDLDDPEEYEEYLKHTREETIKDMLALVGQDSEPTLHVVEITGNTPNPWGQVIRNKAMSGIAGPYMHPVMDPTNTYHFDVRDQSRVLADIFVFDGGWQK